MLTEKQYKALSILRNHPKGVVVGYFAELYYTEPQHQYLVTYAIKKGKLCAGSLLGKLKKRGLVTDRCLYNPGYNGVCKIGYTQYDNVLDRVKQITYANAKENAWQCLFFIETEDGTLEHKIHCAISSLGYKTVKELGVEYFAISVDDAFCLLQAIAKMKKLELQICKIQFEGLEFDEDYTTIDKLALYYSCHSEYLKTQLFAPSNTPKGYWGARDYK